MDRRTISFLGAVSLAFFMFAGNALAKGHKVSICHHDGQDRVRIINVSQNAAQTHIDRHGDHVVGDEVCDGVDNDCDGVTDEGILPEPTTCGVGECGAFGELTCQDGALVDSCTPGAPAPEACDGLDNDCDGVVDNDIAPQPISCGVGECNAAGERVCQNGALVDVCTPGDPTPEVCDLLDNDCDGQVDDNVPSPATTCGVGACSSIGNLVCNNGALVDTCNPGNPEPEVCGDGVDNDCDGQVDEGCVQGDCICLTPDSFFEAFVNGDVVFNPGAGDFCAESDSTGLVFHTAQGALAAGGEAGGSGSGNWACESSGGPYPGNSGFVPGISEEDARACGQLIKDTLIASGFDPDAACQPW